MVDMTDGEYQIAKSLAKLKSQIEIIHLELRQTASTTARLKLMADNAKRQDEKSAKALDGLTQSIAHVENLLQGRAPLQHENQEPESSDS